MDERAWHAMPCDQFIQKPPKSTHKAFQKHYKSIRTHYKSIPKASKKHYKASQRRPKALISAWSGNWISLMIGTTEKDIIRAKLQLPFEHELEEE